MIPLLLLLLCLHLLIRNLIPEPMFLIGWVTNRTNGNDKFVSNAVTFMTDVLCLIKALDVFLSQNTNHGGGKCMLYIFCSEKIQSKCGKEATTCWPLLHNKMNEYQTHLVLVQFYSIIL